jgi:hypothetical protein
MGGAARVAVGAENERSLILVERMAFMRLLVAMCLALSVLVWAGCAQTTAKKSCMEQCEKCPMSEKVLRHVVLFKFKEGTSPQDVKKVVDAFVALPSKIKEVARLEWGTDISPEKKSLGFTHCFLLTFRSEADRDAYLVHPAHKEFGSIVGPLLASAPDHGVCVVDYWAKH